MNSAEKNKIVEKYIYDTMFKLKTLCPKDNGNFINKDKYNKALETFLNREEDIATLLKMIDLEAQKILEEYKEWVEKQKLEFINQFNQEKQENEKLGLTLNRQMIELMMISNATSLEELTDISNKLLIDIDKESIEQNQVRQDMFTKYINDLTDRNTFYATPTANLSKKVSNILNNSNLDSNEKIKLQSIIKNGLSLGMSQNEIFNVINQSFPPATSHNIFVALSESRDLSEPGITNYSIEDYQAIFNKLKDFKSITIDFESKYPAVRMPNGEFYFQKLERCLNFARSLGKDVRLNALVFFEDCPKGLSELEYNEDNKKKVYNELLKYVDETTKMIASYNQMSLKSNGYEVVKSVDIFNELITRFSEDFNGQFFNREDVPKSNSRESGWQKFLNIEDLCEIALTARKNLPNVEFVYNEVNLEEPKKIEVLKSVMNRINSFEKNNQARLNGSKLVDCIGTQMHLKPDVTEQHLDFSFKELSSLGLPLKITEYDQPLSDEFINEHTEAECINEKNKKQQNLKKYIIRNAARYNIQQVTIWSLTDSTNFLLDEVNRNLIKQGEKTISSLYGGAFRDQESFDNRSQGEIKVAQQIREKNKMIAQQNQKLPTKNKGQILAKTKPNVSLQNNGSINIAILLMIVSCVACILSMIVYFLLNQ